MKRLFTALLALMLLCALAVPALADVAYEPDDRFYKHHAGDCKYEHRSYFTNGADGCVLAYGSPTGDAEAVLPNGLGFWIYYTYDRLGERWGYLEYDPDDPASHENWRDCVPGWVKLADMTADYDYRAFEAEHGSEISAADVRLEASRGSTVFCYKYPGSGLVTDKIKVDWVTVDGPSFTRVFTDSAGRDWGYIGYYCGYRNIWVCIDDPCNPELPPDENYRAVNTVPAAAAGVMEAALSEAKRPTAYLYAGAAGVAVIAAAVLVFAIRRKKKTA